MNDVAYRFFLKVRVQDEGCWEWVGAKMPTGYGNFKAHGRTVAAHRFAYELFVGPVPDGLVLDHLCRNPGCVNPTHLEPVTTRENVHRGVAPSMLAHRGNRCQRGHTEFYYRPDGRRRCRICDTATNTQINRRRREAELDARRRVAADVSAALADGESFKAIADRYGCHPNSVRRFAKDETTLPSWLTRRTRAETA